jgi:ABC-type bacteriocin/lantibiotic exporter with double-glycine peptidase domain
LLSCFFIEKAYNNFQEKVVFTQVFQDGQIIEDGFHQELMARNGSYAEMYREQAKWYQ